MQAAEAEHVGSSDASDSDSEPEAGAPIFTQKLAEVQSSRASLKKGVLLVDGEVLDADGEPIELFSSLGSPLLPRRDVLRPFVYVPKGYTNEDMLDAILEAVGLRPPELSFLFEKGNDIAPSTERDADTFAAREEKLAEWQLAAALATPEQPVPGDVKLSAVAQALAAAAAFEALPRCEPEAGATLELHSRVLSVLEGLAEAVSQTESVYLFVHPARGNLLAEIALVARKPSIAALGLVTEAELSVLAGKPARARARDKSGGKSGSPARARGGERVTTHRDPRRHPVGAAVREHACDLGDDVTDALCVTTLFTDAEIAAFRKLRTQELPAGLAAEMTHLVMFASDSQRDAFVDAFIQRFAVGMIAAGGTDRAFDRAVSAIKAQTPLVVLGGTSCSASALADLVRMHAELFSRSAPADTRLRHAPDGSLERASAERYKAYVDERFSARARAREPFTPRKLLEVANNFPEQFAESTVLLVDMAAPRLSIEQLQDEISVVMSAVFDHTREMGGEEMERRALRHAHNLRALLSTAADYYYGVSTGVWVVIRALVLLTTITSLSLSQIQLRDACTGLADPRGAAFLSGLTVFLPIVVGVLGSARAIYRPMHKFGAFFAAAKRIEGEIFRYRARTGAYRATRLAAPGEQTHRERFAAKVELIFAECAGSEVSRATLTGAAEPGTLVSAFRTHGARRQAAAHSGGDASATRPAARRGGDAAELGDGARGTAASAGAVRARGPTGRADQASTGGGARRAANRRATARRGMRASQSHIAADGVASPTPADLERDGGGARAPRARAPTRGDAADMPSASRAQHELLAMRARADPSNAATMADADAVADAGDEELQLRDISVLTAEAYIQQRLIPALEENELTTPRLARLQHVLTGVSITVVALATLLAAFGAALWIPLLLAIASGLDFFHSFANLDSRLPHMNAASAVLTRLLLWWDGLALVQQRFPANKERLVREAETAILHQHEAFVLGSLAHINSVNQVGEQRTNVEKLLKFNGASAPTGPAPPHVAIGAKRKPPESGARGSGASRGAPSASRGGNDALSPGART